ncbi:lipocalin-like protein [Gelidibacter algens]|uniref:Lipocalin-like protein n=1 Tax=Gelidibacter algens TaxID=49280 RepID=A0A1A7R0Y8_9FLAO|nr:lipocalin family protein [Gelidibacter algens]OBX25139.1 hypothetical protein A9996_11580 [Gelidibacter algens]RAJ20027.1 lipocalin-like protein [Gelidibacter algens]
MLIKNLTLNLSLISLFLLISCSPKDNSVSETNSIIGAWKPIKEIHVCSTGTQHVYEYSICEQTGRITLSANGTLSTTAHDQTEGNCVQYDSAMGTWKLNGNNLTIIINEHTNNPSLSKLVNNKLRIGYDADPESTCNGEGSPSHYYTEFMKVQ